MFFEVKSVDVQLVKGIGKTSGKPYEFRMQDAWCSVGGEYRRIRVELNREQMPYAVGKYELDEKSFSVDNYGQLGLRRGLTLRPTK
jgi:Helix-destabilising protein